VKNSILDEHSARDILGSVDENLTVKGIRRIFKDATGSPSPKRDHAQTWILAEREKGDPCVHAGSDFPHFICSTYQLNHSCLAFSLLF
jgi:hypothetical protein